MAFHLTPSKTFSFTPPRLSSDPNAPTFMLRSLPASMMLELQGLLESNQGRAIVALVRVGLVGWSGVYNPDGSLAPFTPAGKRQVFGIEVDGGATDAAVDALPIEVVAELATAVLNGNKLDLDSGKN